MNKILILVSLGLLLTGCDNKFWCSQEAKNVASAMSSSGVSASRAAQAYEDTYNACMGRN